MGWPAEEGTTVVALVALGGMAAGEGVVGTFLGAILVLFVGCVVVGVKRNGLELLVVASLVRRSLGRSFTCTASYSWLPSQLRQGTLGLFDVAAA